MLVIISNVVLFNQPTIILPNFITIITILIFGELSNLSQDPTTQINSTSTHHQDRLSSLFICSQSILCTQLIFTTYPLTLVGVKAFSFQGNVLGSLQLAQSNLMLCHHNMQPTGHVAYFVTKTCSLLVMPLFKFHKVIAFILIVSLHLFSYAGGSNLHACGLMTLSCHAFKLSFSLQFNDLCPIVS